MIGPQDWACIKRETRMSINENMKNAAEKFNLNLDWMRSISPKEILYLVDRCPFLQIVCADEEAPALSVQILRAKTDWPIHFYGDAMSSSPGPLLFDTSIKGRGTLVKQAWDTADEMAEIAKNHGWKNLSIFDAHPLMMRALWIASEKHGLNLGNFTPNDHDWQVRTQLALSSNELEVLKKSIQLQS